MSVSFLLCSLIVFQNICIYNKSDGNPMQFLLQYVMRLLFPMDFLVEILQKQNVVFSFSCIIVTKKIE